MRFPIPRSPTKYLHDRVNILQDYDVEDRLMTCNHYFPSNLQVQDLVDRKTINAPTVISPFGMFTPAYISNGKKPIVR